MISQSSFVSRVVCHGSVQNQVRILTSSACVPMTLCQKTCEREMQPMESTSGTWSIGVHAFANWLGIAKVRTYSVSPVGTSGHPDPKCKVINRCVVTTCIIACLCNTSACFNEQQLLRDPGPQLHRPGQARSQGSPIELVSSHRGRFGGKFFQSALFAYKLISISDIGCSSLVEALLVRIGGARFV